MKEILAPAGDRDSAVAAINAGANAVYLGLKDYSARSSAGNFSVEELNNITSHAHLFGVKVYVAMNTLVKESEIEGFVGAVVAAWNAGADAIIMQDMLLGKYIKETYPQIILHLSTQAGVCNAYGASLAKEYGFSRVILARETALDDIRAIAGIIETEVFVQGALCTCFSGQCYLSSFAGGNSGNRGKCKQPCRKRYRIDKAGFEDYAYRISLSDLSVGESIKALVGAGVSSFKIEGRMRRAEYVSAAVSYYKKLLDGNACADDLSALKRTYNRGNYTKGLAFGQDKGFISSAVQGHIGEYVGTVTVTNGKYFCRSAESLRTGDGFKILRDGVEVCGAGFGGEGKGGFYLNSSTRLKNGDKVFITTDSALNVRLSFADRKLPVSVSIECAVNKPMRVCLNGNCYTSDYIVEKAQNKPILANDIVKCFNKVDTYPFALTYTDVNVEDGVFVPLSRINEFRRTVYARFYSANTGNGNEIISSVLPLPQSDEAKQNKKTAVIARNLSGVKGDIAILKPSDYSDDLTDLFGDFKGEIYLYLPPYMTGKEIERVKKIITPFSGIYCDGYYAVALTKQLNKKLFAGTGMNISNSISLADISADYVALSKELTVREAAPLFRENTFYLSAGGIKVMDLIYCPFSRSCSKCDKREFYTLTDENDRAFPLRRYITSECRFEIFNCNPLVGKSGDCGILADLTLEEVPADISAVLNNAEQLKLRYKNYTKGHTETPVF